MKRKIILAVVIVAMSSIFTTTMVSKTEGYNAPLKNNTYEVPVAGISTVLDTLN